MHTLFGGWDQLGRAVVASILGYVALLVLLRVSGKRTLAKMNVFDFVVIVALGSVLADTIMSPDASLAEGVAAFAVLMAMQTLFSILTRRSKGLERLINGQPTLLLHRGRMLEEALRRERVTEEDLRAAVRAAGAGRLEDLDAVVLETDGEFTALREVPDTDSQDTTLSDVEGAPESVGARPPRSPERRAGDRRRRWAARTVDRR
jgi:uncharacterized membrane protein YcaP (DUF421 family)